MVKKFNTGNKIKVDLTMSVAEHGFEFVHEEDLGEVSGVCDECGHPIRYIEWYKDMEDDVEYGIGRTCQFKLYVFKMWRADITKDDLLDKQLLRAGKWLWIIHRDGYLVRIENLPSPKDYDSFSELADALKNLVFRIRAQIKREEAQKKKVEKKVKSNLLAEKQVEDFYTKNGIKIDMCSDKDKNFLKTVQKCQMKGWSLSEKQLKWFENIKERSEKPVEMTPQKSEQYELVLDLSKKVENFWDNLTNWEQDFITSVSKQVENGRTLSEKQMKFVNKISDKVNGNSSEDEEQDELVGKRLKPWITNKKTGSYSLIVVITSVIRKSAKAVLCNLEVKNGNTYVMNEEWVPFTQIL